MFSFLYTSNSAKAHGLRRKKKMFSSSPKRKIFIIHPSKIVLFPPNEFIMSSGR
jgi:hypothetical protein